MPLSPTERASQLARIERIERGDADGPTLTAAWRDVRTLSPNLRTRMRTAIARSASLPPTLAPEVFRAMPVEMLSNPALPLLLLDAPRLLETASRRFWSHVFDAPSLDPSLLPALIAAAPLWYVGRLAKRREFEAADAPALLARLHERHFNAAMPDAWQRLSDAHALTLCHQWSEPVYALPDALVALLRAADDPSSRCVLARCAALTWSEAKALSGFDAPSYPMELALAGRRDAPADALEHLASRGTGPVRAAVGANPSAAVATLEAIVRRGPPEATTAALRNPSFPRALWAPMLKKGSLTRRMALAARDDLTDDDFALLAAAGESDVRAEIAQHPKAPAAVIATLANDLLDEVRELAKAHPAWVAPIPEHTVTEAPPAAPEKPAKKRRGERASVVEQARPLLEGDMSNGARWREVLAWVASGEGPKPKRVAMSPQDRKKLMRGAMKLLGDDLDAWDAPTLRLFDAMVDALGTLPLLSGAGWVALSHSTDTAGKRALAERWIATLRATGRTEGEALALLLDTRQCERTGGASAPVQHALATVAFEARIERVVALVDEVSDRRARAHFVEDLLDRSRAMRAPATVHHALCRHALGDRSVRALLSVNATLQAVRDCDESTMRALLAGFTPEEREALAASVDAYRYSFRDAQLQTLRALFAEADAR